MVDTAQPLAAAETDPNAQLADAANAFKTFVDPPPEQPRAPDGRFAGPVTDEADADDELEPDEGEGAGGAEADEADEEAAEQAQPLPPSWGAEDEELWATLPPEAQAKIAAREGERDRGLNLKLQETANARKAAELAAKEAQTRRDDYLTALGTVEALFKTPRPDARAFGYGTAQYNAAAYNAADAQWNENERALAQFKEQREAVQKQADEEADAAFKEWKQQHEAEYAPKFVADVPDLTDPVKAAPLVNGLIEFAIANGIPQSVFEEGEIDTVTSAQLHILWMASEFQKLRSAKAAPKPRQAGPAVKPGVSSPRSAQKASRRQAAFDRLDREGSVEAGAAVFKQLFKG